MDNGLREISWHYRETKECFFLNRTFCCLVSQRIPTKNATQKLHQRRQLPQRPHHYYHHQHVPGSHLMSMICKTKWSLSWSLSIARNDQTQPSIAAVFGVNVEHNVRSSSGAWRFVRVLDSPTYSHCALCCSGSVSNVKSSQEMLWSVFCLAHLHKTKHYHSNPMRHSGIPRCLWWWRWCDDDDDDADS